MLFLSDKRDEYQTGRTYLPFTLSSKGENFYLTRNGEIVDYVLIPQLPTDAVYGRAADSYGFGVLEF